MGTTGAKLPRSDIINSPRPGPGAIQPRRPFQGFATFFVREARMVSNYHALELKADKRFSRSHSFGAAYTFSKSIDTGSSSFGGGGNSFDNAQDSNDLRAERGRSAQDARQVFTLNYILALPWMKRNPVLGGWQLAGITSFRTGFSQSPIVAADRCNCDRAGRMRADVVPGVQWKLDNPTPKQFFNTSAFRLPEFIRRATGDAASSIRQDDRTSMSHSKRTSAGCSRAIACSSAGNCSTRLTIQISTRRI